MLASREEYHKHHRINRISCRLQNPSRTVMGNGSPKQASRSSRRIKKAKSTDRVPMAWLLGLLNLIFLVMTTLYAAQTTFMFKKRIAFSSRSHAIFTLRALSELTGLLLAATIAATFERVQWLCVVQNNGVRLVDYIALQGSTGVIGLLALAAGRGVPKLTTRVLSAIRLLSIVLVPVLGVLILSKFRFLHPKMTITRGFVRREL